MDLVARLRKAADALPPPAPEPPHALYGLMHDAAHRISRLEVALHRVVADILEYERVNNLAPNPGREYCWDSVDFAQQVLNG